VILLAIVFGMECGKWVWAYVTSIEIILVESSRVKMGGRW
jgi:hypothetical protein